MTSTRKKTSSMTRKVWPESHMSTKPNTPAASANTNLSPESAAMRLFESLMADPTLLMPLQSALRPNQLLPVIGIVTDLTLRKPISKDKANAFLSSLDEAQVLVFKRRLSAAQVALFEAAIIESVDTVRDPHAHAETSK